MLKPTKTYFSVNYSSLLAAWQFLLPIRWQFLFTFYVIKSLYSYFSRYFFGFQYSRALEYQELENMWKKKVKVKVAKTLNSSNFWTLQVCSSIIRWHFNDSVRLSGENCHRNIVTLTRQTWLIEWDYGWELSISSSGTIKSFLEHKSFWRQGFFVRSMITIEITVL